MSEHEEAFAAALQEWNELAAPLDWDQALAQMTDEWRALEWRSGGETLLAALGVKYLEVPLCRGLAWLLDPNGGHQYGRHFVDAVLRDLQVPIDDSADIKIAVEESRVETRADILIRAGSRTVIIEAKVLAGEQVAQADRLAERWSDENPTLVFLTRSGYLPSTAVASSGEWSARTWRHFAKIARTVERELNLPISHGAREFVETIGDL